MEDTLISFETAKLAKECGFKFGKLFGYVSKFYYPKTKTLLSYGRTGKIDLNSCYYAFTQSALQKRLREKHGIQISIDFVDSDTEWISSLYVPDISSPFCLIYTSDIVKSYEEALEQGLIKALKYIVEETLHET